jgi:hypothetical protein
MIEGSCGAPGKARFDPFCLQYIVSYLSGTARFAAGFIGTPLECPIVRRKSGELHSTAGEELLSANEYRAGPLLLQACKGRINVAIVLAYTTSTCHPIVEAPA